MKEKLIKNIKQNYIFRVVMNLALVDGIFILFLQTKGFSLLEIGLMEGIYHVASLLTEVPSGAFADLVGRKWTLLLSRVCAIISTVLMLAGDNIWPIGIGFIFAAWSSNLISGTEEAFLYDTFLELGQEENYGKTNGRLSFAGEVSQGIALLSYGFLAEYSYELCYVITIVLDVAAILIALTFTEPSCMKKKEKVTVKQHFAASLSIVRSNKKLRNILTYYSVIFAIFVCVYLYSQTYYLQRGFREGLIGFLFFLVNVCNGAGALFYEKFSEKLGKHMYTVIRIVAATGLMVMACSTDGVSVFGFVIHNMAISAFYPMRSVQINALIPSDQRATIISVSEMLVSLIMIVAFPLIGFLADIIGFPVIIFILGVILLGYHASPY